MIIENDNWSPAIDMFDEMIHFDKNVKEIKNLLENIPSFTENLRNEAHLTLEEIKERNNILILLENKIDGTRKVLESVRQAYHQYQEMYFENLNE